MRKSERDEIERRLQSERERVVQGLRRLDAEARDPVTDDGDLTTYPFHLADEGTDAMEKEKDMLLLSAEGRQLYEIDEALRRLYSDSGEFGTCERCGRAIEHDRLRMVPWARYCVACQTELEEAGELNAG